MNYPDRPLLREKERYQQAVAEAQKTMQGVRVGALKQGFAAEEDPSAPEGTRETSEAVRRAVARCGELGAQLKEVSIPEFSNAADIMFSAMIESATAAVRGWPTGYHWLSESSPHLAAGLHNGLGSYADELPETFKVVMMLGKYLNGYYGGAIGARAQAMARIVRSAIDGALEQVDVLVLPTTTHYAHKHEPEASISKRALRGWGMLANAPAFNVSGHPALSMPAASANGLPVGVMVVGRRFMDAQLLSFARTYEQAYGWEPAAPQPIAALRAPRLSVS